MESAVANTIVHVLQEMKVATYDSIRWFDRTYSVDSYKNALWAMEEKGQVKRKIFQAGRTERYVWFLPWYEEDASEKIEELQQEVIARLDKSPSTSGELRQYFRESSPAYHQIAYLALRAASNSGRVAQYTFNDGRWRTIYYLPEKNDLDNIQTKILEDVNKNGFAFPQDLGDSLNISRTLAYQLLAKLAHEGKILRFKIAWNYDRNVPIFAYCNEGYEAKATARFRQLVQERQVRRKRDRLVEGYLTKFKSACSHMKADESLADLASSYFERLIESGFIRGREVSPVAWSAFFLAGKILRQGLTPGDIESFANIGKPSSNTDKHRRMKNKTLLLNTAKDANDFLELNAPDLYPHPVDYLERIVGKMKLTEKLWGSSDSIRREELLRQTSEFISRFPKKLFFGKRPESLAAAALYMTAFRLGITECTQFRIASAADITEVTVRNTVHSIIEALRGRANADNTGELGWMEELASESTAMKARGLVRYIDRQGRKKWGTPEEVTEWRIEDALAYMFREWG